MNNRNTGLDILRILLALMVIAIHFNAPATGHVAMSTTGMMKLLVYPMVALCYPAVNIYVLISGYFGYAKQKGYSQIISSLLKLWLCLVFFSLFGYFLAVITKNVSFSIPDLLSHLLPLSRGVWWFMTVYFVMMLISPALNMVLDRLSKKDFLVFITVALIICSIIPFFLKFESFIGLNKGCGIIWFSVLYLTGGGIYKYMKTNVGKNNWQLWAFCAYLLLTIYLLASPTIHRQIGLMDEYTSARYNSIIVYGQAISLFILFLNINIQSNKLSKAISFLAGLSLAAYIFHCQEDIGNMLWSLTTPSKYANSVQLIPLFIYVVFGVYFISVFWEYVRRKLFSINNFENKLVQRIIQRGGKALDRFSAIFLK